MKKELKPKKSPHSIDWLKGHLMYDNVLVKPIMIEEVGDGIVRPQQYEDKAFYGEVLMVGEGRIFDNGTVIPLRVKAGNMVIFQAYSPTKIRVNGEDVLIIREEDIYWHDKS